MDKKVTHILSERSKRHCDFSHTYQAPEIIDIVDFAGDSYALSVEAQNMMQKNNCLRS